MPGFDVEKSILKQSFGENASERSTPTLAYFEKIYDNELNDALRIAIQSFSETPEQSLADISLLLDQGADPNVGADISNVYMADTVLANPDIFDLLRQRGMDPRLMQRQIEEEVTPEYPIDNVKTSLMESYLYEAVYMATDTFPSSRDYVESLKRALVKASEVFPDQETNLSQIKLLNEAENHFLINHAKHMIILEDLDFLEKNGVITEEQAQNIIKVSPFHHEEEPSQTAAEILADSPDRVYFDPDGMHRHTISAKDTLEGIAARYQGVMEAETVEQAAAMIQKFNGIESDPPLDEMETIKIPLPEGYEMAEYEVKKGDTLWGITDYFNQQGLLSSPYGFRTSMAVVNDMAALNDIKVADIIRPGQKLNFPIFDDYYFSDNLQPPKIIDGKPTTLIVAETGDAHHNETFNTALSADKALDPFQTGGNVLAINTFMLSSITPEIAEAFESAIKNGEDVVVSLSSQRAYQNHSVIGRQSRSGFDIAGYKAYEYMNELANQGDIVFFASAGNSYDKPSGHYLVATSYGFNGFGKNGIIVGAAKEYDGRVHIENYSSPGADFLGRPLALNDGQDIYGTSFSTPDTAALYKELNEFHGGTLAPNEILAAASMSTDIDLIDDDFQKGTRYPARFETNGAGRPYHFRAGAGMIDADRWNENLEKMAIIKRAMDHEPKFIEHQVNLKENGYEVRTLENENASEYVYKIAIPADMTLDKISLIIPQENNERGELVIRSPSGFEVHQPPSLTEMGSTTAFALEDVKAGDVIELRSSFPFTDIASVTIRGYEDGNVVQALRDHLQQNDMMPKPLSIYVDGALETLPAAPTETVQPSSDPALKL